MKTGEVIREFVAKDGRKVILRTLKWEDLDDLLDFINSLVEEGANILRTEKVSRDEEIYCVVAEVDGHVVANSKL